MLQLPTHPTTSIHNHLCLNKHQPRVTILSKPNPRQSFKTTTPNGPKELALCFLGLVVQAAVYSAAIRLY